MSPAANIGLELGMHNTHVDVRMLTAVKSEMNSFLVLLVILGGFDKHRSGRHL
jgi:hypothetical protein